MDFLNEEHATKLSHKYLVTLPVLDNCRLISTNNNQKKEICSSDNLIQTKTVRNLFISAEVTA